MTRVSFILIDISFIISFIIIIAALPSCIYCAGFITFLMIVLCTFWSLISMLIFLYWMCLLFLLITSSISNSVIALVPAIVFDHYSLWNIEFSNTILWLADCIIQSPIILSFLQDTSVAATIAWVCIACIIYSLNGLFKFCSVADGY